MARSRRRRVKDQPAVGVVRARVVAVPRVLRSSVFRSSVKAVEDRRFFHPLGRMRPAKALNVRPRLVLRKPWMFGKRSKPRVWSSPVFEFPQKVAICARRKERREVLHALKRLGAGGGRRRLSEWSSIGC